MPPINMPKSACRAGDVAIAQLNAQDLTLQAAQAAFAKINRQSLFDILN